MTIHKRQFKFAFEKAFLKNRRGCDPEWLNMQLHCWIRQKKTNYLTNKRNQQHSRYCRQITDLVTQNRHKWVEANFI